MLADRLSAAVPIIARHPMKTLHEQTRRIGRWLDRHRWYRQCRKIDRGLILWMAMRKEPVIVKNLDALIVSYGGVGTSMLCSYLPEKHYMVNRHANKSIIIREQLKHVAKPYPSLNACARIIYLFGNPVEAVVSLFKRRFHFKHSLMLQTNFQRFPSFLWAESVKEYAEKGKNQIPFEQHFDFWFNARLRQPVLLIRYETLWDNLDVLFDFLDMPADMRSDFPKYRRRESDVDALPPDVKAGLDRMYGEFSKKLESLPDYILHMPPHTRSSGNAP